MRDDSNDNLNDLDSDKSDKSSSINEDEEVEPMDIDSALSDVGLSGDGEKVQTLDIEEKLEEEEL